MISSPRTFPETLVSPVHAIETDPAESQLLEGIALCLSGGGYRAMLFHTGALWRLNEAGLLPLLDRVSSVSGGSIVAGVLAHRWSQLRLTPGAPAVSGTFEDQLVAPVRRLAGRTIDAGAVVGGVLGTGSVADRVVRAYRKYLFEDATLQDLPDAPRFVINATNVQSGVLWRFSKPFMGDYKVGLVRAPRLPLAIAVAASSAFPPVLSPLVLDLDPADFDPESGGELASDEYRDEVYLTDGGVYDNLGLETAWKKYRTVLVSDGGGRMEPEAEPHTDWARHTQRILSVIDRQVRSLRKQQVVGSFARKERLGTYWGIWTHLSDYRAAHLLPCPPEKTAALANIPTRLARLDGATHERLINWGYAVSDAALRAYYQPDLPEGRFPYPGGVG